MSNDEFILEDSLGEDPLQSGGILEVPLDERPLWYVGFFVLLISGIVGLRIFLLGTFSGSFYTARAQANLFDRDPIPAPRGTIFDRRGMVLADSKPAFALYFDIKKFLENPREQERTLETVHKVLGISSEDLIALTNEVLGGQASPGAILIDDNLSQAELVALRGSNLSALSLREGFTRDYPKGPVFASVTGYLGRPSEKATSTPDYDLVGKAGIEAYYDSLLQGVPGEYVKTRDAKGNVLTEKRTKEPSIGKPLSLTIDGEFQEYFFHRFEEGLRAIGRTTGAGVAMDPRTGEILALFNLPSFDANLFNSPGRNAEKRAILVSPERPLFNRVIGGAYAPGSTIKPLVGLAAIKEGVVTPDKTVFSPGYLDVPNPYDPSNPTRFLDWRYQGVVNLYSAIAQSSNVYFYAVGGGAFDIKGLGLSKLNEWWRKFLLDQPTGIDLPGEVKGFLPTSAWKESSAKRPWRLGDTYNVSIGQGDLLVTPIALLDYVAALANGGKLFTPVLNIGRPRGVLRGTLGDDLEEELKEVQKGMRETVRSPLGTAHLLDSLPFSVAAKTGSAQIMNNAQENAFFVGYAPLESPQIAILILVENAREGSLNAVPIAKDVLAWYYEHRIKK